MFDLKYPKVIQAKDILFRNVSENWMVCRTEEICCMWDKHWNENTREERNGSEQDEKILFGHGRTFRIELKIKVLSILTIYVQMFFYKYVRIFNKSPTM